MDHHSEHSPNGPDRLPADFEPDLRALDERLRRAARGTGSPEGLADRVFRASAPLLAQRPVARPRRAPIRLAEPARWLDVVARIGPRRLAMAACLGLAVTLTVVFLRGVPPESGPVPRAAADAGIDWLEAEADPLWDVHEATAYLLDTGEMTYDEVSGEIESMLAALQM